MVELVFGNVSQSQRSGYSPSSESSGKVKTVYVESHGCAANTFDMEIMIAHLVAAGYRLTDDTRLADLVLVNTCGVKKPTEDRMVERIRLLSRIDKPLIIAGCLPRINFEAVLRAAPAFSAALDPRSIDKVLLAAKSSERGEKNKIFFAEKPILKLEQPKVRLNPYVEIISICEGCRGTCAFCCVRLARGSLFSYAKEAVKKRVSQAVSEGVKEIWLTSQDCGAYGLDIETNLAELLGECCAVEGKFLIRVGMMNPDQVLRMLPELIHAYKNEKVFKFLHLPVQSGDNETLRRMNRRYRVEEFKRIVRRFREEIPLITISTDVICGFPEESREDFESTIKLVEEVQSDVVNISKFFSRPGTPAMRMEQLGADEVKDRSRRLSMLVRKISFDRNLRWLNWEGEIFIDEKGRDSSWVGRNFAYKPIVVKSKETLAGRFLYARVIDAFPTYLEAEIIEHPQVEGESSVA